MKTITGSHLTPDDMAEHEYRAYATYRELEKIETVPEFRKVLKKLAKHEYEDYKYWLQFSDIKNASVSPWNTFFLRFTRKILGLTFTVKLLEKMERHAIDDYMEFAKTANPALRKKVKILVKHELQDEHHLIKQIKEEKVDFISSIILGINDGLIELTGALVGFSFAFQNHIMIMLTGLITGIAASLSMASSGYMQALHETGKDAKKAALYTGISYITVVTLLVLPYVFISNAMIAMGTMFGVALGIITMISYYTSVLFERNFRKQFAQMVIFSVGVAAVSFLIGSLVRRVANIQ